MEKKEDSILTKIFRVFSYIFLAILFLLAIFLVFYIISSAIAKKRGTRPPISLYTIASPSMEPTINVYDIIVDVNVKSDDELYAPSKDNEGTIITFYSDSIDTGGYTVTHRIYRKYDYNGTIYYETKGDNNISEDLGRITLDNIVGRYIFKIPKIGKVQFFLSSRIGWILVILIPALIIIITDIVKINKAYKIKEDISKIKGKNNKKSEDKEKNKKLRALLEKADKMNKK